jgi:hypothetical protein
VPTLEAYGQEGGRLISLTNRLRDAGMPPGLLGDAVKSWRGPHCGAAPLPCFVYVRCCYHHPFKICRRRRRRCRRSPVFPQGALLCSAWGRIAVALSSLRSAGITALSRHPMQVPTIVVAGNQSSGKSSLLEAICEVRTFLASGLNCLGRKLKCLSSCRKTLSPKQGAFLSIEMTSLYSYSQQASAE